jgi:SAM-dependent methyltransferase
MRGGGAERGIMALLSEMLKRRRNGIVGPFIEGDVLDLGCGPAYVLQHFESQIRSYTGVEFVGGHVAQLRKRFPAHRFEQRDLDAQPLALGSEYDVVVMIALIEHLFNQGHVLAEVAAHMRPGGRLVITTPTPFGNDRVHHWGARLGLFSRVAADEHIVIYNRARFLIAARRFGFRLTHYQRFQLGCNQLAVLTKE